MSFTPPLFVCAISHYLNIHYYGSIWIRQIQMFFWWGRLTSSDKLAVHFPASVTWQRDKDNTWRVERLTSLKNDTKKKTLKKSLWTKWRLKHQGMLDFSFNRWPDKGPCVSTWFSCELLSAGVRKEFIRWVIATVFKTECFHGLSSSTEAKAGRGTELRGRGSERSFACTCDHILHC